MEDRAILDIIVDIGRPQEQYPESFSLIGWLISEKSYVGGGWVVFTQIKDSLEVNQLNSYQLPFHQTWNGHQIHIMVNKSFNILWILKRLHILGANASKLIEVYVKQIRSVLGICCASPAKESDIKRFKWNWKSAKKCHTCYTKSLFESVCVKSVCVWECLCVRVCISVSFLCERDKNCMCERDCVCGRGM